jgi:hypothetical protein
MCSLETTEWEKEENLNSVDTLPNVFDPDAKQIFVRVRKLERA